MPHLEILCLVVLLSPLVGGLIAGLFGKQIGCRGAHWVTILLMLLSFGTSLYLFSAYVFGNATVANTTIYHWATIGVNLPFDVGFLIDRLTVFMMVVVTFVSLLVHIYSVGYMEGDAGYQRFFSYISVFTFAMLSLVMANNFFLLFFGWEGVGLVSYLLIGFWFKRDAANVASLKAFLANRVGDLGFLLGIAAVLMYCGSIDYAQVFNQVQANHFANVSLNLFGVSWNVVSLMCILLFIGAIGKSAQIPLHIWLEGSMEGPTPISALIHAATMVTAGVFMVARLSPLFEHSLAALSTVLIVGAATCFFMGILGLVQMDIKRVIAYSTLSQLGYMMAAQGVSAYPIGMFHLMTHAAFKALLFLSAGSVIVALHHEQDLRNMGGLWKKMPVTWICMLIGALALSAIPPFAGFFSKDLIMDAVSASTLPGHAVATFLVVGGALVTALYTFRMFFLTFHGKPRMSQEAYDHVKESHWTILLPLILLAIPAVIAGYLFFMPALNGFFGHSISILPANNVVAQLQQEYHSPWQFMLHALHTLPFWLAIAGVMLAWLCYVACPSIPGVLAKRFQWLYRFLLRKYWIDDAYDVVFGGGSRVLGNILWYVGDIFIIDKGMVEGSGHSVRGLGALLRRLQSGYLQHYLLIMVLGIVASMGWLFLGN